MLPTINVKLVNLAIRVNGKCKLVAAAIIAKK